MKNFTTIILLFLISFVFAQEELLKRIKVETNIDSLQTLYEQIAYHYMVNGNYKELINAMNDAKIVAEREKANVFLGVTAYYSALAYMRLGDIDNSIASAKNAVNYFEIPEYEKSHYEAVNLLGVIYNSAGKQKEALAQFVKFAEYSKINNDTLNVAASYNNIGNIYQSINNLDKSIEYTLKAAEYYKQANKKRQLEEVYLNLSITYSSMKNYDSSLKYIKLSDAVCGDEKEGFQKVKIYSQFAEVYKSRENFPKAENYFHKAYLLIENIPDNYQKSEFLILYSSYLIENNKDLDQAIEMLIQAQKIARRHKSLKHLSYITFNLSQAYEQKNEIVSAHKYLKESKILSDSLRVLEKKNSLNIALFEYEEKLEINQLEMELEYSNKRKTFYLTLSFVFIIVILFGIKFIITLRKKNFLVNKSLTELNLAQNEIIELEKKQSALAMAITANHEINQPLMVVQSSLEMLEMINPELAKDKNSSKYLRKILDSTARISKILDKIKNQNLYKFEGYVYDEEMIVINEDFDKE